MKTKHRKKLIIVLNYLCTKVYRIMSVTLLQEVSFLQCPVIRCPGFVDKTINLMQCKPQNINQYSKFFLNSRQVLSSAMTLPHLVHRGREAIENSGNFSHLNLKIQQLQQCCRAENLNFSSFCTVQLQFCTLRYI